MKKWAGAVAAGLVLVGLMAIALLARYAGLASFVRAVYAIYSLPSETRTEAAERFWGSGEAGRYSGILAGVSRAEGGGVWIWGRKGLKYFAATVFPYPCYAASGESAYTRASSCALLKSFFCNASRTSSNFMASSSER